MRARLKLIAAMALGLSAAGSTQTFQAPRHTTGPTPMLTVGGPAEIARRADGGVQIESGRSPAGELAEHRRLVQALGALQAQRVGTTDAYVVVVALDSDPVFGREARVAGEVLGRRYGAAGRRSCSPAATAAARAACRAAPRRRSPSLSPGSPS